MPTPAAACAPAPDENEPRPTLPSLHDQAVALLTEVWAELHPRPGSGPYKRLRRAFIGPRGARQLRELLRRTEIIGVVLAREIAAGRL